MCGNTLNSGRHHCLCHNLQFWLLNIFYSFFFFFPTHIYSTQQVEQLKVSCIQNSKLKVCDLGVRFYSIFYSL